ncbi:MAG: hypothetical protein IIX96_00435 [Clostridia bacterium]|nr:hypothetical protein [Clostridia bacterium]
MNENEKPEGADVKIKVGARLENFWYHYKWHTLAALFLIVFITVCSIQMCQRESYDIYVMYAGGGNLDRTAAEGDLPEYVKAQNSLGLYAEDANGDGEVNPLILSLYIPTEKEIADIEAAGGSVSYGLIKDNTTALSQNMLTSEYYVCFLSREIFDQYNKTEGAFMPLSAYASDGSTVEYYNECAVYLSSLEIYKKEGFNKLPEDTVVCLRTKSAVSSVFDKEGNERAYSAAEELIRKLLK